MLAGTLGCDGMLRLINTPEDVFADSKLYLDIYIYGSAVRVPLQRRRPVFSPRWAIPKRRSSFWPASSTSNIVHGYPVRHRVQHGCGRRGVGDVPVSGRELRAGAAVRAAAALRRACRPRKRARSSPCTLFCTHSRQSPFRASCSRASSPWATSSSRASSISFGSAVMAGYSAAVKLNNIGHHLAYHARQRHFQLHGAEPRAPAKMDRVRDRLPRGSRSWSGCCALPLVALYRVRRRSRSCISSWTSPSGAGDGHRRCSSCASSSPFYFIVSCQAGFRRRAARRGADERSSWLRRSPI